MTRSKLLIVAAVLVVVALGLFVMPTPGEPSLQCAKQGQPTSGFRDADQNCDVTIASYNRHSEWASGPRWDNLVGVVLVLGAAGTVVLALVRGRKRSGVAAA